jgi:23S rRNA (guanosine2251-2'-O)-methyltransferase
MEENLIFGWHSVQEVVRREQPIEKVYLSKTRLESYPGKRLFRELREARIPVTVVERSTLDRLTDKANHQGAVAVLSVKEYLSLDELLAQAAVKTAPFFLALAQVQDPHNLGSLIRTAEGAGINGIILPQHHSCGLTPAVAKVASGALEYVPVVKVPNLGQTLLKLKERGYKVIGAEEDAPLPYWEADYSGPLVLVLGGEDKGLGPLLAKICDQLVKIPMQGKINSLNVGVAGGILLFAAARNRRTNKQI